MSRSLHTLTKAAALVVATFAALMLVAAPAGAQAAYPGGSVSVNTSTVAPGGSITVTAEGFKAGSTVQFTIESTPQSLGSVTASSSGVAVLTTKVPAGIEAGPHTIRATGIAPDGSPLNVTTTITVSGSAAGGDGDDGNGLANTGSNSGLLGVVGALAVVIGGVALVASRRASSARQTESV